MWKRVARLCGVAAVVGAGCSSAGPQAEGVSTTVVRLDADGTTRVYEYVASSEQYDRELESKRAALEGRGTRDLGGGIGQVSEAISQDSSCLGNDIWIYDASTCSGAHRICFAGQGSANLWNYYFWFCSGGTCWKQYWANHVYSFYPGNEDGLFYNTAWGFTVNFNKWQACTSTNLCNGAACDWLTLTN